MLTEVARAFANERGRSPTILELVSVVTLALKGATIEPVSDVLVREIRRLTVVFEGSEPDARKWTCAMEVVSELGDTPFVLAAEVLAAMRRARHGRLTLDQLIADLGYGIREMDRNLVHDAQPFDEVRAHSGPASDARRGDLVAIPAGAGRWAFAVVLAHNSFGIAWGLFEGRHRLKAYSVMHHPPTHRYSVYTSADPIRGGQWRLVWNHEPLLGLFPTDPERFRVDGRDTGIAESPSGRVRPLSQREARDVGLTDGSYRPLWEVDELQRSLKNQAAQMVG